MTRATILFPIIFSEEDQIDTIYLIQLQMSLYFVIYILNNLTKIHCRQIELSSSGYALREIDTQSEAATMSKWFLHPF